MVSVFNPLSSNYSSSSKEYFNLIKKKRTSFNDLNGDLATMICSFGVAGNFPRVCRSFKTSYYKHCKTVMNQLFKENRYFGEIFSLEHGEDPEAMNPIEYFSHLENRLKHAFTQLSSQTLERIGVPKGIIPADDGSFSCILEDLSPELNIARSYYAKALNVYERECIVSNELNTLGLFYDEKYKARAFEILQQVDKTLRNLETLMEMRSARLASIDWNISAPNGRMLAWIYLNKKYNGMSIVSFTRYTTIAQQILDANLQDFFSVTAFHSISGTNLEVLNMALNDPNNQRLIQNIEYLNLSRKRLTYISPQIGQLTSLKTLNLSENQLECIPSSLFEHPSCSQITLANNTGLKVILQKDQTEKSKRIISKEVDFYRTSLKASQIRCIPDVVDLSRKKFPIISSDWDDEVVDSRIISGRFLQPFAELYADDFPILKKHRRDKRCKQMMNCGSFLLRNINVVALAFLLQSSRDEEFPNTYFATHLGFLLAVNVAIRGLGTDGEQNRAFSCSRAFRSIGRGVASTVTSIAKLALFPGRSLFRFVSSLRNSY